MALEGFDYFKALQQISNDCVIAVPRYENEIDQYSESESEDELPEIESFEEAPTTKAKTRSPKKRVSQFVLDEEALLKRNVILERVKKCIQPPKVPKLTLKRLRTQFPRSQKRPRQGISVSSSHYYKSETSSSSTKIVLTLQKPDDIAANDEQRANEDDCSVVFVKQDVTSEKSLTSSESSTKENFAENNEFSKRQEVILEESIILNDSSSAEEDVCEKNNTPQKQDVVLEKSVSLEEHSSPHSTPELPDLDIIATVIRKSKTPTSVISPKLEKNDSNDLTKEPQQDVVLEKLVSLDENISENDDAPELPDLDIITTAICKSKTPSIISPKLEKNDSNNDLTKEPQNIDEVPNIPIDCSHIKTEPVLTENIENRNSSPDDELPTEVNAQIESAPVPSGGTFHAGKIAVQWQLATESQPTNKIGKIRLKRMADLMSSSVSPMKSKKKTTWHSPCDSIGGGQVNQLSGNETSVVPFNSSHSQAAEIPVIDTQTRLGALLKQPLPCPVAREKDPVSLVINTCPVAREKDPVSSVIDAYHNELSCQKQLNPVLAQLLTEPKKKLNSSKNTKSAKVHVPPPVLQNSSEVRHPVSGPERLSVSAVCAKSPTSTQIMRALEHSGPERLSVSAVRAKLPSSTQIMPASEHSRNARPILPSPFTETGPRANYLQTSRNLHQATSSRYLPVSSAQQIQTSIPNTSDQYFTQNSSSEFGQGTYPQTKSMPVGSTSYNTVQQRQIYPQYQGQQSQFSTMVQPPQPRQTICHQPQITTAGQPSQQRQVNYQHQQFQAQIPTQTRQAIFQQTTMAQPMLQPGPTQLEQLEKKFSGNRVTAPQLQSDWLRLQQESQAKQNQLQRQFYQNQLPVQSHAILNQEQQLQQQCGRMQPPPPYPQQPFVNRLQTLSQTSEHGARAMNSHLATSTGHSPPAANTPPAALAQMQGLISNCSNTGSNNYNYGINGQTSVSYPRHPQPSNLFAQQNNSFPMNQEPTYGYENTSNVRSNGHIFANDNSYPNVYQQNASTLRVSFSGTVESTWSPYSSQSSNNLAETNLQNCADVYLKDFFEHAAAGTNNF